MQGNPGLTAFDIDAYDNDLPRLRELTGELIASLMDGTKLIQSVRGIVSERRPDLTHTAIEVRRQAGLLSTACLGDGLGYAVNRFDPANLLPQAICVLLIHRRLFDRLDHEGLASSRVRTRELNNCSRTTKRIDRVSHPSTRTRT